MPSLNFQKQFVPLIESGQKRQTIRPVRKNPIKVGDTLYLFTGLRTKGCKRIIIDPLNLGEKDFQELNYAVICKSVETIKIFYSKLTGKEIQIALNGEVLSFNEKITLIVKDGFIKDYNDFEYFFEANYNLPFEGALIKW